MLRKLIFPIASGFLIGKGISLYRDRRYISRHPLKSLFWDRRKAS